MIPKTRLLDGPRSSWGYLRYLQRQMSELVYAEIRNHRNHNHVLGSDNSCPLVAVRAVALGKH